MRLFLVLCVCFFCLPAIADGGTIVILEDEGCLKLPPVLSAAPLAPIIVTECKNGQCRRRVVKPKRNDSPAPLRVPKLKRLDKGSRVDPVAPTWSRSKLMQRGGPRLFKRLAERWRRFWR